MANLDAKKALLESEYRKRQRRKKLILGLLTAVVVLSTIGLILFSQESVPGFDDKYNVGRSMNYKSKVIGMTEVDAEIGGGVVRLPIDLLIRRGIIQAMYDPNFDIGNNQKGLPIMAYVSPSGRVFVAASFCEPCYSRKFHIEDEQLVCDTCGTRWTLGDLAGIGGGCIKYPPAQIKYTVDKAAGKILINEADLKNWKPREYDSSTTMGQ